jgi:hypothetical protein
MLGKSLCYLFLYFVCAYRSLLARAVLGKSLCYLFLYFVCTYRSLLARAVLVKSLCYLFLYFVCAYCSLLARAVLGKWLCILFLHFVCTCCRQVSLELCDIHYYRIKVHLDSSHKQCSAELYFSLFLVFLSYNWNDFYNTLLYCIWSGCYTMYPDVLPQLSSSRDSTAQRADGSLKGAGPRNRSRVPPAFGWDPGGSQDRFIYWREYVLKPLLCCFLSRPLMNLLHFFFFFCILFDQFIYYFVNLCEVEKMCWLQDKSKTQKKSNKQGASNK